MKANPRRRDQLRALLDDLGGAAPTPERASASVETAPMEAAPGRAVSGSVKAMRLSLGDMGARAAEADSLRAALARGEQAIEIPADLLDPSFARDRLDAEADNEPDFLAFVEDIRAHGQHTPILVRPSPDAPGRWQIAFGHRRWRAARALGRPALALVRALDDDALVIAQGQENAARRDLSFIERALFALALEERGFSRATLCAALSIHPSEAARLIGVARQTPRDLAIRIGSAPKAGRPRWMALCAALRGNEAAHARALAALDRQEARALDSDARFARALAAATQTSPASARTEQGETLVADAQGAALLRLTRRGGALRIELDAARAPELARRVETLLRKEAARLPALRPGGEA